MSREEEIQDEIKEQQLFLDRYFKNIDSLLGMKGSREVKKSMIVHLAKNL